VNTIWTKVEHLSIKSITIHVLQFLGGLEHLSMSSAGASLLKVSLSNV
jgi:hypothetical protein